MIGLGDIGSPPVIGDNPPPVIGGSDVKSSPPRRSIEDAGGLEAAVVKAVEAAGAGKEGVAGTFMSTPANRSRPAEAGGLGGAALKSLQTLKLNYIIGQQGTHFFRSGAPLISRFVRK